MNLYDVFKSEGGYRVCLQLWGTGDPIINYCPWYASEAQATANAQFLRFQRSTEDVALFWNDYVFPECWTVMWNGASGSPLSADYQRYPDAVRAAREVVKSRGFSDAEINKFRPSWSLDRLEGDAV